MSVFRPVLIDSGVWVTALKAGVDADAADLVRSLVEVGRAATCEVVTMEVPRGVTSPQDFAAVNLELRATTYLEMDGAGDRAARLSHRLRARCLTIPPTDLLIAATCALHGAALLHRDKHLAIAAEELGVPEFPTG
jgi:predicted nucleic acid-binding protein